MDSRLSIDLFIDCFVDYTKDNDNDSVESYKNLKKNVESLSKLDNFCKEYSDISKYVYELSESDFNSLKNFFDIGDEKKGYYNGILEGLADLSDTQKDNLKHFERHIKLSCHQRDYINNNVMGVSEKIGDVMSNVEKARNKVNNIYSEFVGILGVFTALSFALMGSVQVFGNILKNIDNPTIGNVGYVLIVGGIYLILIYLVIMTLFIGMGKVFNRDSKYQFDKCFTWCIISVSVVLIAAGSIFVLIG